MGSLIVWTGLAALVAYFGRKTRFGFWGMFAASMVFTPLGGVLLMIPSAPKTETAEEV